MKENYKSKKYLHWLISEGRIRDAIECLEQTSNDSIEENEFKHLVIQLKARYSTHEKHKWQRTVSMDDEHIELNQIIFALLGILKEYSRLFTEDGETTFADIEPIIDEMAYELALNYIHISFGEEMPNLEKRSIFSDKKDNHYLGKMEKSRNILIVGAGATHASCPYIPFGRRLKEYLEYKNPRYKQEMSSYMVRSSLNRRFPFDPEDYLGVLNNKLGESERFKLRDSLQNIYNKKYLPTHVYEKIAHMFKHQFFDVIINVNFDELLDEAIQEEMGSSNYYSISNEADCENLDNIIIDGRLKTPIYIKIHGTASAKSTLKFTRDQHRIEVPAEMRDLIIKLISGQMTDDPEEKDSRVKANIICLGFELERAEFHTFLTGNLKSGSKFFQVNWSKTPELEDYKLDEYFKLKTKNGKIINRHIKMEDWAKIDPDHQAFQVPMAGFFNCLWEKVSDLFTPYFKPRGIARHCIIADVFYHAFDHKYHHDYSDIQKVQDKYRELTTYFRSSAYFFERTVAEVAILLVKNKGIIEPREAIKEERIGRFYSNYKKIFMEDQRRARMRKSSDKSIKRYLLEDKGIPESHIKDYCLELYSLNNIYMKTFRLVEWFSFSRNLLNIRPFDKRRDKWRMEDKIILRLLARSTESKLDFDDPTDYLNSSDNLHILVIFRLLKNFSDSVVFQLLAERCRQVENLKEHLLKRTSRNLDKIRSGFTYDITPRFRDSSVNFFESLRREDILHTNLALSYQFRLALKSYNDWDVLLLISERGKFLANQTEISLSGDKKEKEEIIEMESKILKEGKQIIIIACHEAVAEHLGKSSTKNKGEKEAVQDFYEPIHIRALAEEYLQVKGMDKLNAKMHLLPYWRHHHHMALFLKFRESKDKNDSRAWFDVDKVHGVEVFRSIYYFKQGFSNKINPLFFPCRGVQTSSVKHVQNDQELLLSTFFAHYLKALVYETGGKYIPVLRPGLVFEHEGIDEDIPGNLEAFLQKLKKNHRQAI